MRCDAFDFYEQTIQQPRVFVAARSLLFQPRELHAKYSTLPFTQPVIGTVNEVTVEPLAGHTATIVDGAGQPFDFILVSDDDASFPCGHQLAGLEAERAAGHQPARGGLLPGQLAPLR